MVAAGLWLLGRGAPGFSIPSYAVARGPAEAGSLRVRSGMAGLRVNAFAGATQLAVGQFPSFTGPTLELSSTRAHLTLDARAALPFMPGEWAASLVKGLPWSLTLHSIAGDLALDLRDLMLTRVEVRSLLGDVDLTAPVSGQGTMLLDLRLGDLTLRLPDGAALRLTVQAGPAADARIDDPRLTPVAPGEWQTAQTAPGARPWVVQVQLGAGDLRLV